MAMDVIKGILVATQKGWVRYEVIIDAGGFSILECEGYFLTDIKVRLSIQQVYIQEIQKCGRTHTLIWDGFVLIFKNGYCIFVGYHCQTALTVLQAFPDAVKT